MPPVTGHARPSDTGGRRRTSHRVRQRREREDYEPGPPGRLAHESVEELPPVTAGTFCTETSSMKCHKLSTLEVEELADGRLGAAVPRADDVSRKTGTILTLVLVFRRALLNDYLGAYKCAMKEVGRRDSRNVCSVASVVVFLLMGVGRPGTAEPMGGSDALVRLRPAGLLGSSPEYEVRGASPPELRANVSKKVPELPTGSGSFEYIRLGARSVRTCRHLP